jgi:hypothetical protein
MATPKKSQLESILESRTTDYLERVLKNERLRPEQKEVARRVLEERRREEEVEERGGEDDGNSPKREPGAVRARKVGPEEEEGHQEGVCCSLGIT